MAKKKAAKKKAIGPYKHGKSKKKPPAAKRLTTPWGPGISAKNDYQMSVSVNSGNSPVTATVSFSSVSGWKGWVDAQYSTNYPASVVSVSPASEIGVNVPDQGSNDRPVTLTCASHCTNVICCASAVNENDSGDGCSASSSPFTIN